jgi:hypothetical protein
LFGEGEVGKGHWPQFPNRYWNNGSQLDDPLDLLPPLLLRLLPPLLLLPLLPLLLLFSSLSLPLVISWCLRRGMASESDWVIKRSAKTIRITLFTFIFAAFTSFCFSHSSLSAWKWFTSIYIYIYIYIKTLWNVGRGGAWMR